MPLNAASEPTSLRNILDHQEYWTLNLFLHIKLTDTQGVIIAF